MRTIPAQAIQQVRDGRLQGRADHPGRLQPKRSRRAASANSDCSPTTSTRSARRRWKASSTRRPRTLRDGYVTAREPKLNEIALRPSKLFVTVDYDRSLIPGVIVMALFMGSLTSGVFNWVMDRFMGVTECYLVTPLSRWNLAGGILGSSVLVTSCAAIIVLVGGLADHGRLRSSAAAPALLMLAGIIILGATGILAMTFALLARADNPRVVGASAGFLNVILFFPSGAVYPVESFPRWLRVFARLQSRNPCGQRAEVGTVQGRGL